MQSPMVARSAPFCTSTASKPTALTSTGSMLGSYTRAMATTVSAPHNVTNAINLRLVTLFGSLPLFPTDRGPKTGRRPPGQKYPPSGWRVVASWRGGGLQGRGLLIDLRCELDHGSLRE